MACWRPAAAVLLAMAVLGTAARTSQAQAPQPDRSGSAAPADAAPTPSTDAPPARADSDLPEGIPGDKKTPDTAGQPAEPTWQDRYGPASTDDKSPGGGFLSSLIALGAVLTCIVVGGYLLRRFMPGLRSGNSSMAVQVLARTALSPRQSVYLVRCGRRLLILGAGTEQVRTLGEIDDPEEVAELAGRCEQQRPNSVTNTFRDIFRQQSREMDTDAPEPASEGGPTRLQSEVRDIKGELEQLVERVHDWKRASR